MAKQKYLTEIEKLFEKSPVVDFKSIERVRGSKNGNGYAKLLLHNLIKKGKINKIGKGFYTRYSEITLSVFAFKPAYLGLQSALSCYGIWEQETIPIILTTKKVRRGIRKVIGANVLIRNVDKTHFFGYEFVKEGNFYIPYSDLEKTFIDMILFNQKMSPEVVFNIRKKIDKNKLLLYLKRYSLLIKLRAEKILGF